MCLMEFILQIVNELLHTVAKSWHPQYMLYVYWELEGLWLAATGWLRYVPEKFGREVATRGSGAEGHEGVSFRFQTSGFFAAGTGSEDIPTEVEGFTAQAPWNHSLSKHAKVKLEKELWKMQGAENDGERHPAFGKLMASWVFDQVRKSLLEFHWFKMVKW